MDQGRWRHPLLADLQGPLHQGQGRRQAGRVGPGQGPAAAATRMVRGGVSVGGSEPLGRRGPAAGGYRLVGQIGEVRRTYGFSVVDAPAGASAG